VTHRTTTNSLTVSGTGICLPGDPLSTEEVQRKLRLLGVPQTEITRTARLAMAMGVNSRYFCRSLDSCREIPTTGQSNPELSASALRSAADAANLPSQDLDYLITHTATPHTLIPPSASWLAKFVGYDGPFAELRQACTGFANALQLAAGLCQEADASVGIVGSETGSVFFDPSMLGDDEIQTVNLAQMGDGAGAIVVRAATNGSSTIENMFYGSSPKNRKPGMSLRFGGSSQPFSEDSSSILTFDQDFAYIQDQGLELFDLAVDAATAAGVSLSEMEWVVVHQANGRMAEILGPRFGIPQDRFFTTGDTVGNTGSASIWITFHLLRESGKLNRGDRVLVLGAEATCFLYGGFLYRHGNT